MYADETQEIPCSSCGSYQDDCQCTVRRETLRALHAQGMEITDRMARLDYDLAMARRALREWGYERG